MNGEWTLTLFQRSMITALTFVVLYPLFCEFFWWLFTRPPSSVMSLGRLLRRKEREIGEALLPVCKSIVDGMIRAFKKLEER